MPHDTEENDEAQRQWLKEEIQTGAFVTSDQHEILNPNGGNPAWLFDFRNIFLQPEVLEVIANLFWNRFNDTRECQIGGMESAAIPLITAIVLEGRRRGKKVTGFYVRKSRKKIGLMKQIEGSVSSLPVILVDDLVNSGRSLAQQVELLKREGLNVQSLFTVLQFRQEKSYRYFTDHSIPLYSLFTLPDFSLPFQDDARAKYNLTFRRDWYFKNNRASYTHVVPKALPLSRSGNIFWGADNGHAWCLESATGTVRWHQKLGLFAKRHLFSSPVYFEDNLFFATHDGSIYKLRAADGKILWREEIGEKITATPLIMPREKIIVVGTHINDGGGIVALHAENGERMWDAETEKPVHGSGLLLSEGHAIMSDQNGTFYTINARGAVKTRKSNTGPVVGALALNKEKTKIFWGTMKGEVYTAAPDGLNPTLLFEADAGIYGSPLAREGKLLVAALDKNLYCIDAGTGALVWVFETRGRIFASPVVHEGVVYIGSNDARMYALDEKTGKEMGFFQTTERITSSVVVDEQGKLLVTTFANELYALSVSKNAAISAGVA